MKQYRPWNPAQSFLLPPSPMDWLPGEHLAYFILDVVQELDLGAIEGKVQAKDHRGTRPHAPQMMVALLLYSYCVGVYSSRKIALGTYENVAMRVIAGGTHPHFTTINQFRQQHLEHMKELFGQGLKLCSRAGLVKLGHVALDGTKIAANASKHKAMSYERMQQEEERLQTEIELMMARAEKTDAEEDARYGAQNADEIPEELRRRESRLAKIREAKRELELDAARARAEVLEERAAKHAKKAASEEESASERKRAANRAAKSAEQARVLRDRVKEMNAEDEEPAATPDNEEKPTPDEQDKRGEDKDEDGSESASKLPEHRVPTLPDGTPRPTAQHNFTDPDSKIMVSQKAFVQAYNAQAMVEESSQVILAPAVSNQAPDNQYLEPMLERTHEYTGQNPDKMSADAGYFSLENVKKSEERGIDPYIAAGRKSPISETQADNEQQKQPMTPEGKARQKMQEKLASDAGRAVYSRRKAIVEPVFGQIKEARGFRRFSFRGLSKVRAEWFMVCLCHNLLKLFRSSSNTTHNPAASAA
jgi:transposase